MKRRREAMSNVRRKLATNKQAYADGNSIRIAQNFEECKAIGCEENQPTIRNREAQMETDSDLPLTEYENQPTICNREAQMEIDSDLPLVEYEDLLRERRVIERTKLAACAEDNGCLQKRQTFQDVSLTGKLDANNSRNTDGTIGEVIELRTSSQPIVNLVDELEDLYKFRIYNNELYVEKYTNGDPRLCYYDLIKTDQGCADIRRLIPRKHRRAIKSDSDIRELLRWISIDAKKIDILPCYDTIMFKNSAYNWRSQETVSDTTELFIRGQLQVDYEGGHRTGAFTDFIESIFDSETVPVFYQFLGLCLSEVRFLKYVFYILGETNSGKTVLTDLLSRIIGEKYISSVSFSDFSNEFYISSVLGSKINIGTEVSGNGGKRAETLLSMSGREYVTTAKKYQDPYQQKSNSLLVFTTNGLPQISLQRQMSPLLERMVIFPIRKSKKREKWNINFLNLLLEDSDTVIDKALQGLRDLEANNWVIRKSPKMEDALISYSRENDSFTAFVTEKFTITDNPKDIVRSSDIDAMYDSYCALKQIKYPLPQNQRSQILVAVFGVKKDYASRGIRGYKGIKSTETATNSKEDEYWSNDKTQEE